MYSLHNVIRGPNNGLLTILVLLLTHTAVLAHLPKPWRVYSYPMEIRSTQSSTESLLEQDKTVESEVKPGQTHLYRINLRAGQYSRVVIEHWGADLVGALRAPNGRVLLEFSCRQNGMTPVALIAESSGTYALDLRAGTGDSVGGRYRVRIEEIRQVVAQDSQRLAAQVAFADAERLRAEERESSSYQAIKRYEEAAAIWRGTDDRKEEAQALKNIGEVYQILGETERAFKCYQQAVAIAHEIKDARTEVEVLNDIGYLHFFLGDMPHALECSTDALKLSQAIYYGRGEAQAHNNRGEAYFGLADFTKALESQGQALAISRALNDRRVQAQVLVSLGYAYMHLGESQNAQKSYQEALSLWRAVGSARGQALTFIALGNLQHKLGEDQEALNSYFQAQRLLQPIGDRSYNAYLFGHMGYIYEGLGEKQRAIEYYGRALELYQATNHRWGEAEARLFMGRIYHSTGNYQEAIKYYNAALNMFRTLAMPILQALTLSEIGLVYYSSGEKNRALDYYAQALRLFRAGQDRRGEAYTLNYIGRVHESSGENQRALEFYKQGLELLNAVGDRQGSASSLYNIAHAERSIGRLDSARAKIELAIQISETLRTKVASNDLRASLLASTHQQYEFYVDVLMLLHKQHPSDGFDTAAFEASERGRARSLLEALAESRVRIRQGVDAELLERERQLQGKLNEKMEQRIQLTEKRASGEELGTVDRELGELTTEYQQVQGQIRASSPRYAALVQPVPLTLREIQQRVLDSDTILLEYALGAERSFVWAVTSNSIKSYELPSRSEVEKIALRLYASLTARNRQIKSETVEQRRSRIIRADSQYVEAARELSRMLLEPVASELKRKRLVVVADGAMQYVPFSALPAPALDASGRSVPAALNSFSLVSDASEGSPLGGIFTPLIVEHEIVSLPSASVMALMREELLGRGPAPKAVAVIADPVFDSGDERLEPPKSNGRRGRDVPNKPPPDVSPGKRSPEEMAATVAQRALRDFEGLGEGAAVARLPFSRREAEAIMAMVPPRDGLLALGFRASRATATGPELSQYRIIHFATHGFLNSEQPELSGILLSLFDEAGRRQDGFLQLHEIYNLNLPAELVVLSACQTALGKDIRGEGLVGLTRGFMYAGAARVIASLWKVDDAATAELMGELYRGMLTKGLKPTAALRAAQIHVSQQQRWRSPYYWAAFTLQGEWR